MTPTDAQIDAAKNAYRLATRGDPVGVSSDYAWRAALTAAAEVGEQSPRMVTMLRRTKNATIERCAQELELAFAECNTLNLLHGAARIRTLKDGP